MVAKKSGDDRLETLRTTLDVARRLAHDLHEDELFVRLVNVFTQMPEADRGIVIGALEHEVQTRLLSQKVAADLTRIELRPNPNARLYLRVIEPDSAVDEVEMLALMRAVNNVQRGIDAVDPTWRSMIVVALRQMAPAARAQIDGFNRAMRALLDDAAAEAGEPAPAPSAEPCAEPTAESGVPSRPRK